MDAGGAASAPRLTPLMDEASPYIYLIILDADFDEDSDSDLRLEIGAHLDLVFEG